MLFASLLAEVVVGFSFARRLTKQQNEHLCFGGVSWSLEAGGADEAGVGGLSDLAE